MTSVGFFIDRLRAGLERDAAQLLGADLVRRSPTGRSHRRWSSRRERRALSTAETVSSRAWRWPSTTRRPVPTRRAAVVGQGGVAGLSAARPAADRLRRPARRTKRPPASADAGHGVGRRGVAAGAEASASATRSRSATGASASTRLVTLEPDRGISFVNLSPRVLMRLDDLAATHLIQAGSRETHRLLVAGPPDRVAAFRDRGRAAARARPAARDRRTRADPTSAATLDRAERFLALVALLTACSPHSPSRSPRVASPSGISTRPRSCAASASRRTRC